MLVEVFVYLSVVLFFDVGDEKNLLMGLELELFVRIDVIFIVGLFFRRFIY